MYDVRLIKKTMLLSIAACLLLACVALSCDSLTSERSDYIRTEELPNLRFGARVTGCSTDRGATNAVWAASDEEIWHYDGSSWRRQYKEDQGRIMDIYCLDKEHVWAAVNKMFPGLETSSTFVLFYDGTNWSRQFECGGLPSDIFALDENHVWLVAPKGGGVSGIYFFDGSQWSEMTAPADEVCISVSASDPSVIWVGTMSGSIYRFDGMSWNKAYSAPGMIKEISALDHGHAWATAADLKSEIAVGYILFYDGVNWNTQFELEDGEFTSIDALGPQSVWASFNFDKVRKDLGEQGYVNITEGRLYAFNGNGWELQWQEYPELIEDLYVQDIDHVWLASILSGIFTLTRP
jgi:hypothetical protein